jgi:hypothetical protein
MFCHLKPWQSWQSWQVIVFYECLGVQIKNPFDEILNLNFDLEL